MKQHIGIAMTSIAMAMALFGACGFDDRTADTPDEEDAAPATGMNAVMAARCSREARCGTIGIGSRYEDDADCRVKVENGLSTELAGYDCPSGVHREKLDECLADIREYGCHDELDLLAAIVSCREEALCQ
jgi:hypothetical protein